MFGFWVFLLSALLALVPSCSRPGADNQPAWSVQLKITGGFTGRGNGSLRLAADGAYLYEPPAIPNSGRKPCDGKLTAEELTPVTRAINHVQPKNWNLAKLKVAAPDAFGYELELRSDPKATPIDVVWYDNTSDQLPDDLKQLSEVLKQTMENVKKKCPG